MTGTGRNANINFTEKIQYRKDPDEMAHPDQSESANFVGSLYFCLFPFSEYLSNYGSYATI